jgi:TonB family protein
MLSELQKLKKVGPFKQTEVKVVSAQDYFPSATEVVQATYTNGSQYVVSTMGKFPTSAAAGKDFETQIKNVKDNGGSIYSNESKNGTQASAYKYNDFYFIEACGQGVCSRNNSNDLNALRTFATNFSSAVNNSSKFRPSTETPTESDPISGGVLNSKATNLVTPQYPVAAKAVRASGTVNVQVTVDESGNVISASAVNGHPLLKQSAEQAARASKFNPIIKDGQAVKYTGVIVYNFIEQ